MYYLHTMRQHLPLDSTLGGYNIERNIPYHKL
jgi:hypothetical protein